jgi:gag-polypeptide of LTR copia-type
VTAVNLLCKADVWVASQDEASMDTGGFKIDKLNDKNYHTWKQKIELLLAFRDLDEVVFGDPPPDMATDEEAGYAFKKLDAKAKAVIGLTLSDEHLEHVRDAQTAADMWKCLMNAFQRCSLLNKLAARRRFYTVSMEEDEHTLGYINRVRHMADELKSMDCVVGDEEVVMAILNGLPSEYDHLIVALDAMGGDGETKLTLDVTKSRLLQGEQRKNERCGREGMAVKNEQAAALIGNARHKKVWGPGEVRSENICHRCHKPGHIA